MKINELNKKVDNAAMYILLFIPFVIVLFIKGIEKIVKIVTKKEIHILDEDD